MPTTTPAGGGCRWLLPLLSVADGLVAADVASLRCSMQRRGRSCALLSSADGSVSTTAVRAGVNVHGQAPPTYAPRVSGHRPGRRVLVHAVLAMGCALPPLGCAAMGAFERGTQDAFRAFERGDYKRAERLWQDATEAFPAEALAWANLGTCLIINASDEMRLGEMPEGRALQRLEDAVHALTHAQALGSTDALLLNSLGNAQGLLQRWEEARHTYEAAAAISPRDFESIPRSNAALISFQLGELPRVEREARTLIRRDPQFVDGQALLAAARWSSGDLRGATAAFEALCAEPVFCARYSTDQVVLGRWTPRAVDAYRGLLGEASIKLIVRNSRALS